VDIVVCGEIIRHEEGPRHAGTRDHAIHEEGPRHAGTRDHAIHEEGPRHAGTRDHATCGLVHCSRCSVVNYALTYILDILVMVCC